MLSNSAWNALLKIMEEPPAHVIFILATTEVHKVPDTILSRCQRFDFRRVPADELVERLARISKTEKIAIDEEVLQPVSRLSEGCVRDAESILEQLFALGEEKITVETASLVLPRTSIPYALKLLAALGRRSYREALECVGGLLDQGIDLEHFNGDLLELFRKVLLIKLVGSDTVAALLDAATLKALEELAKIFSTAHILFSIEALVKAKQALKTATIPQLPLEVAVVEICGVEALAPSSGGVDLAIQGSSSVSKTFGRADAPNAVRPQPPGASLRSGEKGEDISSASATLLQRSAVADQSSGEKDDKAVWKNTVAFPLEEIKNKWPELLKKAQDENHSLVFLLSTSEPLGVANGVLKIGVQYPFHRDKLNEIKCRTTLEKVVADVYQAPLRIEGVMHIPAVQVSAVSDVLSALGGRVVG